MPNRWCPVLAIAAVAALTVGGTGAGATVESGADGGGYTFAVIGDMPYGPAQFAVFPEVIAQLNADPAVAWVNHLGDIKSGASVCDDGYFQAVRSLFDRFADPLVYTPGDNEWTDCHRLNNGAFDPLDRLAVLRQVFFDRPGHTLGQTDARVISQVAQGVPENVRWRRAGVAFAALHVVGSNNGLAPWTGNTAVTPEQAAEVQVRTAAVVEEIEATFADARSHHAKAVALMTQADMFFPGATDPRPESFSGFRPIVAAIAEGASRFRGPVYLFNGDTHEFHSDTPLATGSRWLDFYGIQQPVPNLSRVTVDGAETVDNYLRVTVHPRGPEVLTWTQVPFTN